MTTDTVPQTVLFPDLFDKPLHAQFNQEQASPDGGAFLLKAAERIYGLVKAFAGCLFDKRAPDKTQHSLADLVGERIFGIACGHPDCNDGDRLADDPIHKQLLAGDPVSGERLASQPTLLRFEDAVNGCAPYRMTEGLATGVIERHRRRLDGGARRITIDLAARPSTIRGSMERVLRVMPPHAAGRTATVKVGEHAVQARRPASPLVVEPGSGPRARNSRPTKRQA